VPSPRRSTDEFGDVVRVDDHEEETLAMPHGRLSYPKRPVM
jgi:hypothetical protein